MRIAITGSTGFIGSHLETFLKGGGAVIISLTREMFLPEAGDRLRQALTGVDVVINLAGAPIFKRWTTAYKREIYNSRILTTRRLVEAINSLNEKPFLLISASAIGYYDTIKEHDESSQVWGSGFLAQVCHDWEAEARLVSPQVRLAITRFALVLSRDGGTFPLLVKSIPFGVAVKVGRGRQSFSWIALTDLLRAMQYIIETPSIESVVNISAPWWISNSEFSWAIAYRYKAIFTLTIPFFIFRLLFGESSQVITKGYKIYPRKLLDAGFVFMYTNISMFLLSSEMASSSDK